MIDDKKPREIIVAEGKEAKAFIEHPMVTNFLETMESSLYREFSSCEEEEQLKLILFKKKGVEQFRHFIHSFIVKGQMAEQELREREQR